MTNVRHDGHERPHGPNTCDTHGHSHTIKHLAHAGILRDVTRLAHGWTPTSVLRTLWHPHPFNTRGETSISWLFKDPCLGLKHHWRRLWENPNLYRRIFDSQAYGSLSKLSSSSQGRPPRNWDKWNGNAKLSGNLHRNPGRKHRHGIVLPHNPSSQRDESSCDSLRKD